MRHIFVFIVFLFSFNVSAEIRNINYVWARHAAAASNCGASVGVKADIQKLASCLGANVRGSGSRQVIKYGAGGSKTSIVSFSGAATSCPLGQFINDNGVCSEPEQDFCQSDKIKGVRQSAQASCVSPLFYNEQCDSAKEQFLSSCTDFKTNDTDPLGKQGNPNPVDPIDPNGGGTGGNTGGNTGSGDSPCILNCGNESDDPTKTFCSSAAAISKVNSNRALCSLRAGSNTFSFVIKGCSESTKRVKTECNIDTPPDPTTTTDPTTTDPTTNPDSTDNKNLLNKLSSLESASTLGLNAIRESTDYGFNELGTVTADGFNLMGDKFDSGFDGLSNKFDSGFDGIGAINKNGFDSLGKKLDGLGEKFDGLIDNFSFKKTDGFEVTDEVRGINVGDLDQLKKDIIEKKKVLSTAIDDGYASLKNSFTLNISSSGNDSDLGFNISRGGKSIAVANPLTTWSKYYNDLGMVIMMLAGMSSVVIVCSKN